MSLTQNDVPRIHINAPDADMLGRIKMAVLSCCAAKDFTTKDIAEIAEFRDDGVTLALNYGEAMILFGDDPLLGNPLLGDKGLGLFADNICHTNAHVNGLNKKNAEHGVRIAREPLLDDEFYPLLDRAKKNAEGVTTSVPKADNFDEALAKNNVTVVGEIHEHESPRLSIASKLPELGAANGALLVEHLFANRQGMLDDWLAAPANTPMPPLLKVSADSIKGRDADPEVNKQFYGTLKLIEDAKRAGVHVYGFETDATLANNTGTIDRGDISRLYCEPDRIPRNLDAPKKEINTSGYYRVRVQVMNEAARDCIETVKKKHGKTVLSTGSAHAISQDSPGVPGVADYFGGAAVEVKDIGKDGRDEDEKLGSAIVVTKPWKWADPNKKTGPFLLVVADPVVLKKEVGTRADPDIAPSVGYLDPKRLADAVNNVAGKLGEPKPPESNPNRPSSAPDVRGPDERTRFAGG